jgi:large subunit ribosomal protein L25
MDGMEKTVINATRRPVTGKKVGALRREGKLPAVVYGYKIDATPILLDHREASRTLAPLSKSHIVTILLDGKELATLVREKQKDFIRNTLVHIDFQVVSMTEKIRTKISIVLEGVSAAVKDYNGVVVSNLSEVEVEALPGDLPERIVIDIADLKNLGDAIYVRDLRVPETVAILTHPEEVVVNVTGQAAEEAAEEVMEGSEPEVIEKGKKEEDEEE